MVQPRLRRLQRQIRLHRLQKFGFPPNSSGSLAMFAATRRAKSKRSPRAARSSGIRPWLYPNSA
jgi:hypothetical protein